MATEAQLAANRLNAEKSTGPRTAEGKAVVAQNAVKHGLLAREGVLRGEDWEEWENHREMLLEDLRPAGGLEVILAARIVDLSWRLHRAAQDQNETFGALYDRHTAGAPEPAGPAERGATLGRMILEDLGREAALERLLRNERRIEGSLYRTLNELRRVHDQGCKADLEAADTLERWREEDGQARKARAFALSRPPESPFRPDGGTTNTPHFEVPQSCDIPSWPDSRPAADAPAEEMCETNPIGAEPEASQVQCDTAVMSDSPPDGLQKTNPIWSTPRGTGIPPVSPDHGQDAHATELPDRGNTKTPAAEETCETNPICPGTDVIQVPFGTEVMSDSAPDGPRKTNPISAAPRGTGIPSASPSRQALPVNPDYGRDGDPKRDLSRLGTHAHATHGQDAHATVPPDGGTTNGGAAQGQLRQTNPMCDRISLETRGRVHETEMDSGAGPTGPPRFCGPEGPGRRRSWPVAGAHLPGEEPDAGDPYVRVWKA